MTLPVTSFDWKVDGRSIASGNPASFRFPQPGRFQVEVFATTSRGIATARIEIEATAPVPPPELDPRTLSAQGFKLRVRSRENECVEGYRFPQAAIVMACGNFSGQTWKLLPRDQRTFLLTTDWVQPDGLCLEGNRPDPALYVGGASFMAKCGDVTGQIWIATRVRGEYFTLRSLAGIQEGRCLDGNVTTPGAFRGQLWQSKCP